MSLTRYDDPMDDLYPDLVPGQMLDESGKGLTNLSGYPLISPDFEEEEREAFCDECKEYHSDTNRDHPVKWLG